MSKAIHAFLPGWVGSLDSKVSNVSPAFKSTEIAFPLCTTSTLAEFTIFAWLSAGTVSILKAVPFSEKNVHGLY